MKLKDTLGYYEYFSGKASELARQLGLAGIAILWVFAITHPEGNKTFPPEFSRTLFLLVLGLAFDFLQYVSGALIWGAYNRYKEHQDTGSDEEFLAPQQLNWPTLFFFWFKICTMIVAYLYLFTIILPRIF